MKVLFFMSHAGATRNFESTIRELAAREHSVHLAFERTEKKNLRGFADLANALAAEYSGVTLGPHPVPPRADDSWTASKLRASLDYMRYFGPEFEHAPKVSKRAESWVPAPVHKRFAKGSRVTRALMRRGFRLAERATPVSELVLEYLRDQGPDVVLFTPLLEPGSVQVEYLRAANRLGIPTCLCVHSWDNLTNKGVIHESPDLVTVWNEMQRDEAIALHGVPEESVLVTGAVSHDHWFGWQPSRSRIGFTAAVGLDSARPFVLYVGSSGFIAPDEAGFIGEWVSQLHANGLSDTQILVRPHPQNRLVGKTPSQRALAELDAVKLYPPEGANPTDVESRQDYFDSMYYCAAIVGVNTTAFLEAAILGRPVFTVLDPRYAETQQGMLHFDHLLRAGGGLLHVAPTYAEHAEQLRAALARPAGEPDEQSRRFTEVFIRPHGVDRPATPILVSAIEKLVEGGEKRATAKPGVTTIVVGGMLTRGARVVVRRSRARARAEKPARDAEAKQRKQARQDERARRDADKAEKRARRAAKEAKNKDGSPKARAAQPASPESESAADTPRVEIG